jgi:hypothetical protein
MLHIGLCISMIGLVILDAHRQLPGKPQASCNTHWYVFGDQATRFRNWTSPASRSRSLSCFPCVASTARQPIRHRVLAGIDPHALEEAYVQRDVTYLIGGNDDDPARSALDKSCPAEARGPHRLARARNYFAYLQMRHPSMRDQRLTIVPDAGHDGEAMLTFAQGIAALFGER